MPTTGFRVTILIRSQEIFQRMSDKISAGCQDVFDAIIDRWTAHRQVIFDASEGMQDTGLTIPGSDVFWAPLSDEYKDQKKRDGFDDHLMVLWGDTMESLTNRDDGDFFEHVDPTSAVFGSITKPALINQSPAAGRRPVMFFDEWDMKMIPEMFVHWLGDEPPFRSFTPAQDLDAEFAAVMEF